VTHDLLVQRMAVPRVPKGRPSSRRKGIVVIIGASTCIFLALILALRLSGPPWGNIYNEHAVWGRFLCQSLGWTSVERYPSGHVSARRLYRGSAVLDGVLNRPRLARAEFFDPIGRLASAVRTGYGTEVAFYPEGAALSDVLYRDGLRSGPFIRWFPDGGLAGSGHFDAEGRYDGTAMSRHPNGRLATERTYTHGTLMSLEKWDASGCLTESAELRGATWLVNLHSPGGSVTQTVTCADLPRLEASAGLPMDGFPRDTPDIARPSSLRR
jgi:hypothetical protein